MSWRWFSVVGIAVLVPASVAEDWLQHPSLYTPIESTDGYEREYLDYVRFYDSSKGGNQQPEFPYYSQSIEAAWEVVEQLRHDNYIVIVQATHQDNLQACIIARGCAAPFAPQDFVLHPRYLEDSVRVAANTAPLAICRAALRLKTGATE